MWNGPYLVRRLVEGLPKMRTTGYFLIFVLFLREWAFCLLPLLGKKEWKVVKMKWRKWIGLLIVTTNVFQLCSNYANPEPFLPVNTWDRVNKKHININCPDMIKDSKKSIVGVGLADMLVSLCRKTVKAKRWCLKILSWY